MKKILFTIQWYPPKNSANVLCDDKIIKELLKNDEYEIHCLVYHIQNAPDEDECGKVKIHRFSKGPFFDYFVKARDKKSKLAENLNRIVLRIKQFFTIPIYPCYEPIAAKKNAKNAIKLHKKEHFDLVISEHHGYDSLYAGYKLKEFDPKIKFISILWDPFSGKEPAKYLPHGFAEKKIIKSEKKILGNADAIIALKSSKQYHMEHSKDKPYFDKYHFLDIPGIVEKPETDIPAQFIKEGKINIVYSGVLSLPERDPEYVVKLLNSSSIADKINLIFLANGNGKDKLPRLKEEFKGEMVINGYVSQTEINAIYHKAEALINLGGSNPTMVPSKIFEYMAYGKPIISTYYIDGETSKDYLASYPSGLCIDQRKPIEENIKTLEEFIDNKLGQRVAFDTVKALFPENTPESYVNLIDEVLK